MEDVEMVEKTGHGQSIIVPTGGDTFRLGLTLEGIARAGVPGVPTQVIVIGDVTEVDNIAIETVVGAVSFLSGVAVAYYHLPFKDDANDLRERRPSAARNLGLAHARHEQVVFFDQDCIPDVRLLALHCEAFSPDTFIYGLRRRLHISRLNQVRDYSDLDNYIMHCDNDPRYHNEVAFPQSWFTCNASAPLAALLAIGGFDITYDGSWGFEDSDAGYRLQRSGLTVKVLKDAYVTHLNHPAAIFGELDQSRYKADFERTFSQENPVVANGGSLVSV